MPPPVHGVEPRGPSVYHIPRLVQYHLISVWVFCGLMAGSGFLAAHYGWLRGRMPHATREAGAFALGVGAVATMISVRQFLEGRWYVLSVEWNDDVLLLRTRRDGPRSVPWSSIACAKVPSALRRCGGRAARQARARRMGLARADLVATEGERPYRIFLAGWDPQCRAFLDFLEHKVNVAYFDGKWPPATAS